MDKTLHGVRLAVLWLWAIDCRCFCFFCTPRNKSNVCVRPSRFGREAIPIATQFALSKPRRTASHTGLNYRFVRRLFLLVTLPCAHRPDLFPLCRPVPASGRLLADFQRGRILRQASVGQGLRRAAGVFVGICVFLFGDRRQRFGHRSPGPVAVLLSGTECSRSRSSVGCLGLWWRRRRLGNVIVPTPVFFFRSGGAPSHGAPSLRLQSPLRAALRLPSLRCLLLPQDALPHRRDLNFGVCVCGDSRAHGVARSHPAEGSCTSMWVGW